MTGRAARSTCATPLARASSLLDIGRADSGSADADSLLDTATVGDYGGQLWMLRLWKPGRSGTAATQQVSNWHAARSFRVANLAGRTLDPEAVRAPFSYMTLNAVQPDTGYLRTFVGTGDRENLLDKGTVVPAVQPARLRRAGLRREQHPHRRARRRNRAHHQRQLPGLPLRLGQRHPGQPRARRAAAPR